jgi:uncharacterized NAD(P)/FAD-binding protein YdhS
MVGTSEKGLSVVIIGGCFAGCLTAAQLLRKQWHIPISVTIVEKSERFCMGLAYGTTDSWHYLNVHAGNKRLTARA